MNDDAEIISEFLVESHENLDQLDRDLVELEQQPGSRELLSSIFRTIHTIKGTSGFLAFNRLEAVTHAGENLLSRLRDGHVTMDERATEVLLNMVDTVRLLLAAVEETGSDTADDVDTDAVVDAVTAVIDGTDAAAEVTTTVDVAADTAADTASGTTGTPGTTDSPNTTGTADTSLADEPVADTVPDLDPVEVPERRGIVDASVRVDVDLLDSLVQLVGELVLTRNQVMQKTEQHDDVELVRAAQRLDLVASELQESVMKTRMQPIGQVWSKMPRVVRDLSHQLGRQVELEMVGHDTELDRSLLEALKGPLTHLVRNSLDHGIEPPDVRVAAGKPAAGRLLLRAYHESGQVVVEISDDGAGIDPVRIGEAAVQRGLVTREQLGRYETRDVVNLIFHAGFSTAAQVTNVSGRGVGMDVVRTNIERIGGSVDISSVVGAGTTCRVRIPLTLAIIPALVVGEGRERYAIPQANLVELARFEGDELARNIEVIAGARVLRLRGHLLPLVSLADALGIDAPGGDTVTVVVLQSDDLRFGLCVSEVHDTQEIVVKPIGRQLKSLPMYAGATIMGDGRVALIFDVAGMAHAQAIGASTAPEAESPQTSDDTTALLVLEVAGGRRAAIPLMAVSRLEEFPHDRIERTGTLEAVQYRDGILPLLRLAPAIGLVDSADDQEHISVIVHEADGRLVGIVIDQVLDVVNSVGDPSEVGRRPGVLGTIVAADRVTDLVDIVAVTARTPVGA